MLNSKLYLFVLPLLLLIVQPSVAAPIKIAIIGDSITEGDGPGGVDNNGDKIALPSFRRDLWFMLKNAGYDVDFVGSENATNTSIAPLLKDYDPHHEGHSGKTAEDINTDPTVNITQLMTDGNYTPDVALIHLGTNDLLLNNTPAATIRTSLEGIIAQLQNRNPNMDILVAKIIPMGAKDVSPLNSLLDSSWATSQSSGSSTVKIVDQFTGINTAIDSWNTTFLHPNAFGENKMAGRWFSALISNSLVGSASGTRTPVGSPNPAIPTDMTLWLDATDIDTDGFIDTNSGSILSSSHEVTLWKDRSGNSNHVARRDDGSGTPTQNLSILNGRPTVDFGNDGLISADSDQISANSSYTKFVVFKYDTTSPANNLISSTPFTTAFWGGNQDMIRTWNGSVVLESANASPPVNPGTAVYHVASTRYASLPDTINNVLNLDGTELDSNTIQKSHGSSNTSIGSIGNNFYLDGKIAEAIIYNRALTSTEVRTVETYLSNKWGIPLAPTDQTINFTPPSNANVGTPFSISATATSGLTVSFASTTPSVCTISANTVSPISTGTCTITANQGGDSNFNPAPQVTGNITINKGNQTINLNTPASKTLGDAPFAITATATSGLAVTFASTTITICTVNVATITILNAGICTITADQAGDANYNAAPQVSADITVDKADQTISFNPPNSKAIGDAPFAISATATSGLAVSFASTTLAVCTVNANIVTILDTGTCTLTADQAGNTNFNPAPQVTNNITVIKANQTIGFNPPSSKTIGDAPFLISAAATSGLPVSFASTTLTICTVSVDTVTILDIGVCTLTANQAGNASFNPAAQITANILVNNVGAADQTISFNPPNSKAIGDAPFAINATATSGLAVSFASTTLAVCTVNANIVTILDTGICALTADQAGNANFNPAPQVTKNITVSKANQTIGFNPPNSKTIGDAPFLINASATSGLPVSFVSTTLSVCTVNVNTVTLINIGTCIVTADQAGNASFNPAPQITANIIVNSNTSNLAAVIDDILGNANNIPATAEQINSISGVNGAVSGTDYSAALAAGIYVDPANPTAAEIQTVVDAVAFVVTALSDVVEDIEGNLNGTPATAEQINSISGVSGAVNLRDYATALAAGTYADRSNPTADEIQTIIDQVNASNNSSGSNGGGVISPAWFVLFGVITLLRRRHNIDLRK